ncbi:hypothetical protein O181_032961 [Austropuccinia psidii MF-1]|uniref:Chromo domain-containing protein n=1 Tax=Austropuccinia psidii MF-1 TaxID=1389203 RepID=A0A9Q3CXU0_9BASI|nr:hypothetical protein [Austropuccinia psidii MF-1]
MWKGICDTAANCIAGAKEYNKQRYDKTHMEPYFKEGDQVEECSGGWTNRGILQETPSIPSESGQTIHPDSRGQDPLHNEHYHPPDIVEVEDSPGPVRKIIKARKIRLNGKDQRQYLVRFKNQTEDTDKWFSEDAISDENLNLRRFRASRRTEQTHQC